MVRFAERHPIWFSLLLYAILNVGQMIWLILLPGADPLVLGLPGKITICAVIVLIMTRMRWWREVGFGQRLTWHTMREYAPALLRLLPQVTFLMIVGTYLDSAHVLGWAAMSLMEGFSEEAVYRGLSMRAFLPSGWLRAVLLTSLIFGVGHITNVIVQPLGATLNQIAGALAVGLVWATLRLTSDDLFPAMLLHAASNFVLHMMDMGSPMANHAINAWYGNASVIIAGLLVIYSIWRLWQYGRQQSQPAGALKPQMQ